MTRFRNVLNLELQAPVVDTSSCRQTELKTMLSSYFYNVKMRVKQL